MIIDVSCINFAALLCFPTLQVLVSCIGIGILNIECAVLPPASNSAAIPEDATATDIFFESEYVLKVCYTKCFSRATWPINKKMSFVLKIHELH